ncbi:hypothetical protein DPMN_094086 [Dreissena polymorpha]|uniref:Uncharacterized protein n=1 Tax=Dreissena polymorpha TaxID=45954 RepID=A0A9D4L5C1_DREPO|nr:hypothetical protein DPMN_094086 [Dreissena polymorpha]
MRSVRQLDLKRLDNSERLSFTQNKRLDDLEHGFDSKLVVYQAYQSKLLIHTGDIVSHGKIMFVHLSQMVKGYLRPQVFRRKKLVIRLANAGGLAGWLAGWRAGWRAGGRAEQAFRSSLDQALRD